jgi:cell division protein FtsX
MQLTPHSCPVTHNTGSATIQGDGRPADDHYVDAAISGLVPGLFGLALIVLALISYRWVSPTVGGQFLDDHPNLRSTQRVIPPVIVALVGLGLVAFALAR